MAGRYALQPVPTSLAHQPAARRGGPYPLTVAFFDIPAADLPSYRPELPIPEDLDEFWAQTLSEVREHPLDLRLERVEVGLDLVEAYDVEFSGFGGHRIRGWYTRPVGDAVVPAVVEYVGYGGGRGLPHERLAWAVSGRAHLVMDTRGQGSKWGVGGATPDPAGSGPAAPGVMTRGIESPHDHYYRRVFSDGVRAVEAVRAVDGVDASRVSVTGGSQGGGITLAVAGLVPDLTAVMPDVPFLCQIQRAVTITDSYPYREVADYLSVHRRAEDQAMRTFAYLDAAHLGTRATAPALFSVALMDSVCPPSTVYAAFNHYGHPQGSEIDVYRYNGHEGGAAESWLRQQAFLRGLGS